MVDSKAIIAKDLICEYCEAVIYTCDGCSDYFKEDGYVSCKNGKHYHLGCIPEDDRK